MIQFNTLFHSQRHYTCLLVLWVRFVTAEPASTPLHWVNSPCGASWWRAGFKGRRRLCAQQQQEVGEKRRLPVLGFVPTAGGPQHEGAPGRSVHERVWGFLVQQLWLSGGFMCRNYHIPYKDSCHVVAESAQTEAARPAAFGTRTRLRPGEDATPQSVRKLLLL